MNICYIFYSEQNVNTRLFTCFVFGHLDTVKLDCSILQIAINMNIFLRDITLPTLQSKSLCELIKWITVSWSSRLQNNKSWASGLITNDDSIPMEPGFQCCYGAARGGGSRDYDCKTLVKQGSCLKGPPIRLGEWNRLAWWAVSAEAGSICQGRSGEGEMICLCREQDSLCWGDSVRGKSWWREGFRMKELRTVCWVERSMNRKGIWEKDEASCSQTGRHWLLVLSPLWNMLVISFFLVIPVLFLFF